MHNWPIEVNLKDEPIIAGTDITVACILEELCSDDSIDKICNEHHLTREQVHAALSYAEMNLPQSNHLKALDSMLNDATPDDGLDYSLLAGNAGYISANSCSLRLLHSYRKRIKHIHTRGGTAVVG